MKKNVITYRALTRFWPLLATLALILLGAAGYTYWKNVYSTPDAVFRRMLSSSLQTIGFTRIATQSGDGQSLDVTSLQTTAPYHQVRAENILKQGEQTTITTESITTTNKNFVRYNDIQTDQTKTDGSKFDFNQILGQWGDVAATENDNSITTIYTGNVIVPFANLSAQDKETLLNQIITDGVYELDYDAIKTEIVDGRKTYIYDVTVNPVPYIKMLKTLSGMLGQDQLADLNPDEYANVDALKFSMYVDVLSSQLTRVVYSDQSQTTEYYRGYGIRDVAPLPSDTIPLSELQTRLQQIQ